MRKLILLILTLAVAIGAAACERPANEQSAAGTAPAPSEPRDPGAVGTAGEAADAQQTVNDLVSGNMTEVELGRLAQQKAASPDVKAFGEMMERDHGKALDALKAAAQKQNLRVPAVVNEKHRELRDRLSMLSGAEFDREFMKSMVEAHQATLQKLDKLKDGSEPLNQFAATIQPTVQQHLERARQINGRLSSS
jgi:putative membrane protein